MWICKFCEAENYDQSLVCSCCSKKREETSDLGGYTPAPRPPRKKKWFLILSAWLVLILILGFFTIHIWVPATCTDAATCRICGKIGESAVGHIWVPATCTDAEHCKTCGKIGQPALGHKATKATCLKESTCTECQTALGSALGHDWIPATYNSPKTCSRCNIQEGHVKGYIGDLSGQWDDDKTYLRGDSWSNAYLLNKPVNDCLSLSMSVTVNDYTDFPFGEWYLYARDLNGDWSHIGLFKLTEFAVYGKVYTFQFDPSQSFDALAVVKHQKGDAYSINFNIRFYNAQVLED